MANDEADLASQPWTPPGPRASYGPSVLLHLKIGWWMLLAFVSLGIVLESMHGFKIDYYLNVEQAAARVLWTLTHSIGAILGLFHIAFAASVFIMATGKASAVPLASACLNSASMLLPAAFVVAAAMPSERSVALGFLLAVPGFFFFLLALLLAAWGLDRQHRDGAS